MRLALVLVAASALAAACATPAPPGAALAEADCSIRYIQSDYDLTTKSVPTSGSEKYCRRIREENQRYAERAWRQRAANAEPPAAAPQPSS